MKTLLKGEIHIALLTILVVVCSLVPYTTKSQSCNFLNPGVTLNYTTSSSGTDCIINFDLSFDLAHNDGNKWVNIHIWPTGNYPNLSYQQAPKSGELSLSSATIVIDQRASPVAIFNSYQPDVTVTVQSSGLTVTRAVGATFDRYTIKNISITAPTACNAGALSFTGDAWASQSDNGKVVHCVTEGFSFVPNDPIVTGSIICGPPNNYSFSIQTSVVGGVSGTYQIYRDENQDLFFNAATDALITSTPVPWSAAPGANYLSGVMPYAGNASPPAYYKPLIVVVSITGLSNTMIEFLTNGCIGLPVGLNYFNAERNNMNVRLTWATNTENNNYGFSIERNYGNGAWQEIGFVLSKAADGNSNAELVYSFTDVNTSKSITQYRLRQVDINQAKKYSDVRSVRGLESKGSIILYPNPSYNGKVNIVFEDKAVTRDVAVTDMGGRVVKQLKAVSSNSVVIENLVSGMYTIRITVPATGEQVIEKVIVNKQ